MFVRYRYMTAIQTRYKTVELIVDEKPWVPQNTPVEFLSLYIEEDEEDVKQCVQLHGGPMGRRATFVVTTHLQSAYAGHGAPRYTGPSFSGGLYFQITHELLDAILEFIIVLIITEAGNDSIPIVLKDMADPSRVTDIELQRNLYFAVYYWVS